MINAVSELILALLLAATITPAISQQGVARILPDAKLVSVIAADDLRFSRHRRRGLLPHEYSLVLVAPFYAACQPGPLLRADRLLQEPLTMVGHVIIYVDNDVPWRGTGAGLIVQ